MTSRQTRAATAEELRVQREIGRRLKLVRIACGYKTTRAFASALSGVRAIHEDSLGHYLRGDRPIQMHDLIAIREVTQFSTDWLLYGDASALNGRQREAITRAEEELLAEEQGLKSRRGPKSQR